MIDEAQTRFLTVDLDIVSARPLQSLVDAFGRSVLINYVGREGGRYTAHLGLVLSTSSADGTLRAWVRRVKALPPPARRHWNAARSRELNIGIQAGMAPFSHVLRLEAATLRLVAGVGAHIGITIYAPGPPAASPPR